MRSIKHTRQFKQDVKRMKRRGKSFDEFKQIIEMLASGQELTSQYRNHKLVGQYEGTRECHIAPDWLLIYELTESELVLIRTGTHSDLFSR